MAQPRHLSPPAPTLSRHGHPAFGLDPLTRSVKPGTKRACAAPARCQPAGPAGSLWPLGGSRGRGRCLRPPQGSSGRLGPPPLPGARRQPSSSGAVPRRRPGGERSSAGPPEVLGGGRARRSPGPLLGSPLGPPLGWVLGWGARGVLSTELGEDFVCSSWVRRSPACTGIAVLLGSPGLVTRWGLEAL
ncbi:hypothetical protein LUU34_00909300 [Aix galericulata]|nr:hypothetical protein LUU34_00909300 [Aix galericulata]